MRPMPRSSRPTRVATHRPAARVLLALAGLAACALTACQAASDMGTVRLTDRAPADRGRAAPVTVTAFRADEPRRNGSAAPAPPMELSVRTAEQADEGIAGVEAVIGAPEPAPVSTRPPAPVPRDQAVREVLVDQVVGQINGEPVFAAAFFEPMDARLRAQAARVSNDQEAREFIEQMIADIAQQLRDQMENQLLLDEFRAMLSPDERVGIAALVQRIQTDLQRGAMGSRELADRRLRDTEGRSLEEQARHLSDRAFINEYFRRTITNRIAVSARDVQQEYERRWAEFNPPAVARLRVIRVPSANAETVANALRQGRSFTEVAAEFSTWRAADGNIIETTLGEGGVAQAEFFGVATLNDPARALAVGQTAGPIEVGTSTWWLRLDEVHRPPGISLFEAQIQIESELRERRFMEERRRQFDLLLERSNFSDRTEMIAKLSAFGAQRYLGITIPDAPRPGPPPRRR